MIFAKIKDVSLLDVINGMLYVVDEKNRLFIFDEKLKFLRGARLKFPKNQKEENGVKLSFDGTFLAVASENEVGVWDLKDKKFISSFTFKKPVLSVAFDENDYLACGGVEGKVYLINLEIAKIVASLKHKDFISDIEFVDKEYIVAGGFDKAVVFFNLSTFHKKLRFLHIKPVKKIKNKNHLISADEISDVIKWDVLKHTSSDRVDFYKKFRDFFIEGDFLNILSSKGVIIYDLQNEVVLNENFLNVTGDKIAVVNHKMIIATEDGLFVRNLFAEEKELIDAVYEDDFKKAYELLDKNPYLRFSKGYERLKRYEELLIKKALLVFEKDYAKAVDLLQPLMKVPFKFQELKKIIEDYKHMEGFKKAVLKGDYALAYELANMYENLKKSRYYELLEKKWQQAYKRALLFVKRGEVKKAEEILRPFLNSSKMKTINLLLKKGSILSLFREKLAKKDFQSACLMVKEHPELKESFEYRKLMDYAKKLYLFALDALKNEEIKKAKKAAEILFGIEKYKPKAKVILDKIEILSRFLAFVAEGKYDEALEMGEVYEFLRDMKTYKNVLQKRSKQIKKLEKLVFEDRQKAKEYLLKEKIKNKRAKKLFSL